jgi:hypothetical protein
VKKAAPKKAVAKKAAPAKKPAAKKAAPVKTPKPRKAKTTEPVMTPIPETPAEPTIN